MVDLATWEGRIWYVDDDSMLLRLGGVQLKTACPRARVQCFSGPAAALKSLRSETPDILISDFQMPEMLGDAFLREAHTLAPTATRCLLSSDVDAGTAAARALGVTFFPKEQINKPLALIDALLRVREEEQS